MKKITLLLDSFIYSGFNDYLKQLNGVLNVEVDFEKEKLFIEYDNEIISLDIIWKEINLYLETTNTPSLIGFNKHSVDKLSNYEMIIDDICCEYCLKGFIAELLVVEGIEEVSSNFDYDTMYKVSIYIKYNNKLINEEELKEIEKRY